MREQEPRAPQRKGAGAPLRAARASSSRAEESLHLAPY